MQATVQTGCVTGGVRTLLRLEGLAVLAAAVFLYWHAGFRWGEFAVLFLAPDLSFIAYLFGPRVGATAYNAAHTYVGPVLLGALGLVAETELLVQIALIWITHIGVDRALGYGLKYPTAFKDTHLQRV